MMKKKIKELTPLQALRDLQEVKGWNNKEFHKRLTVIKKALKDYELMKQARIIVVNKEFSDENIEKLKNQRVLVGSLEQCEVKSLFDEQDLKKLKAFEIIKEMLNQYGGLDFEEVDNGVYVSTRTEPQYGKNYFISKEKAKLLKEVLK